MDCVLRQDVVRESKGKSFYVRVMRILKSAQVPFLVGGAEALRHYSGVERDTKDFDLFLLPSEINRALEALAFQGIRTELTFPHWLGKAIDEQRVVDLIFSSANGVARVDEKWFEFASEGEIWGERVQFIPVEEGIWSKAYVMERERFDGADVCHLILKAGKKMNWERLLHRFGEHWRVLFVHLISFGFVYPEERECIPHWVNRLLMKMLDMEIDLEKEVGESCFFTKGHLAKKIEDQQREIGIVLDKSNCEKGVLDTQTDEISKKKICYGGILSREQYLVDLFKWNYEDARLKPRGNMSPEEVQHWTAAIKKNSANN